MGHSSDDDSLSFARLRANNRKSAVLPPAKNQIEERSACAATALWRILQATATRQYYPHFS
jgi:hypothetical protein